MNQLIDKSLQNSHVLQNINAIDRGIRMVFGTALISAWLFVDMTAMNLSLALLPLVGALVALSGVLGWCPVYAVFGTKSCGVDGNNCCGTLPFQISELFKKH